MGNEEFLRLCKVKVAEYTNSHMDKIDGKQITVQYVYAVSYTHLGTSIPVKNLFLGNIQGTIGETSALAILIGAVDVYKRQVQGAG